MKTNWPAVKYGCVMLASLTLTTMSAPAQTLEPTSPGKSAAVISSVAITQAPEVSAGRVEGEGKLDVRAARMQHPDRLVLDFVGARLAVHKTVIPGVSAPVVDVRMGQYQPNVARVVIDLTTATPYHVSRDGKAVVISFSTPAAMPVSLRQNPTLTTSLTDRSSQPRVGQSAPSPRKAEEQRSASANKIPAPRFALPGELTEPPVPREEWPSSPGSEPAAGGPAGYSAGKHGGHNVGDFGRTNASANGHAVGGEVHRRTYFGQPEGRGSARLFPADPRNQRFERGAGPCGKGKPDDCSR